MDEEDAAGRKFEVVSKSIADAPPITFKRLVDANAEEEPPGSGPSGKPAERTINWSAGSCFMGKEQPAPPEMVELPVVLAELESLATAVVDGVLTVKAFDLECAIERIRSGQAAAERRRG